MPNSANRPDPHAEIGGYQVLEELGRGAAGTVHLVRQTDTGSEFALKILADAALQDEGLQRRFLREISVMRKLDHDGLVRIVDAGLHHGSYFYVMEVVDAGTLQDVLGGPLPWRDVAESGLQLCEALAVLHADEVVHRDMKPANIYLSSSGQIKIGDFGLARDLGASRLTLDNMTVGTASYMAPEQIMAEDQISGGADIYALGCVLFEMMTGQPPFSGKLQIEVLQHHLTSTPPNVCAVNLDCPADFARLIDWMLEKRPENRPADASRVADCRKRPTPPWCSLILTPTLTT